MRTELLYDSGSSGGYKIGGFVVKGNPKIHIQYFHTIGFSANDCKVKNIDWICNGADGINFSSTYSVCSIDVHLLSGSLGMSDISRTSP